MSKHFLTGILKVVRHLSVQWPHLRGKTLARNNLDLLLVEWSIYNLVFSARLAVYLLSQSLSGQLPTSRGFYCYYQYSEKTAKARIRK